MMRNSLDSYISLSQFNERTRMVDIHSSVRTSLFVPTVSKWTIVRERLPEILTMSTTYRPTSIRSQLILLIALMNKQSHQLQKQNQNSSFSKTYDLPTTVIINIDGRRRYINMKLIPPQQMIHIDIDEVELTIPTRDFIMAISRGDIHDTAMEYCPPAIRQMLIDLSKTKLVHDGRLYKRALFKIRLGKVFYSFFFLFIVGMMFTLVICISDSLWKLSALNSSTISPMPIEPMNFFFDNETFVTFD